MENTNIQKSAQAAEALYRRLEKQYDKKARQVVKHQILLKTGQLEGILQRLQTLEARGSLAELLEMMQQKLTILKHTADDLDRPFRLFVIGTGNVGKSTLINALIGTGQEYAKTKFLPTTWKIDIYTHRQDHMAELRFADGKHEMKTVAEARQIEYAEEIKAKEYRKDMAKKIREIKAKEQWSQKAKDEAILRFRREKGYQMKVTEAFWPVPDSEFLQRFQLVDTPGMGQELWGRSIEASAQYYYERADGILWILPADEINEKGSMLEMDKAFQKFHTRMDRTIAVVNKMDKVQQSDPEKGYAETVREAKKIYGGKFPQIHFLSAVDACRGIKEYDAELLQSSGLQNLQDAIRTTFFQRAQEIQLQRIEKRVADVWADLLQALCAFEAELHKDVQRYHMVRNEFEEAVLKEKKQIEDQIDLLFQKALDRVSRNAHTYENKVDAMGDEQERRNFLQEHVLEYDVLQEEIDFLQEKCANCLLQLSKQYQEKSSFSEYKELEKALKQNPDKAMEFELGIGEEVFSTAAGQAVLGGAAALGAAAVFGPLGIAAGLLAITPLGKNFVRMVRGWFGNSLAHDIEQKYQESFEKMDMKMKHIIYEKLRDEICYMKKIREITFCQHYLAIEAAPAVLEQFRIIETLAEAAVHEPMKRLTLREMLSLDNGMEE